MSDSDYTLKKNKNEEIAKFLKKNKNFLIQNPYLLKILEFPSDWKSGDKIIDFNVHQSKKLKKENDYLKSKISNILIAGQSNFNSQNRIFKASLRIINAKSIDLFLKIIIEDCPILFDTDIIYAYSNNKILTNIRKQNKFLEIDEKILKKIFIKNNCINLSNKIEYLPIFFQGTYKVIKSFILLKIRIDKKYFIIFSIGSKDKNKFSTKQRGELINFFIKICEYKIKNLIY